VDVVTVEVVNWVDGQIGIKSVKIAETRESWVLVETVKM
jgi:hypothetical protein